MKKITLLLPLLLFSSCSCSPTEKDLNREDNQEEEIDINRTVSSLNEDEYYLFPRLYLKKLSSYSTYQSVTKGSTKASVSFIGIPIDTEQSIDATVIKGDYSYLKNESHSTLVNTVHTAYFHNDKALSKNDAGNEYSLTTLSEYLNIYGTYPFDQAIEGYLINKESINSITKLESEENHSFKIDFNIEKSVNNVKIQMREFGGLDDYPNFEKVEMTISIKDDFTPININLQSKYTAKKGMVSTCEQHYQVTFSSFNEVIDIPDLELIKNKFN